MMRCLIGLSLVIVLPALAWSGDKDPSATLASPFGTVIVRGNDAKPLGLPSYQQAVPKDKDLISLPGLRGLIDLKKGGVRLHLIGNLPDMSSSLALESVARLHGADGGELDFTLVRGRALVENQRAKGAAKFTVRVGKKVFKVELPGADSKVVLERVSYWPQGSPFPRKADKKQEPVEELLFLVLQGDVAVAVDDEKQSHQGPVLYRWSSTQGRVGPVPLKKVPDWAATMSPAPTSVDALQKAGDQVRRFLEKKNATLAGLKTSADANLRILAALGAPALDDAALPFALLNTDPSKAVRAAAATALRHYQGRGFTEDLRVFDLITKAEIKAGPAAIIMELLHGIPPAAAERRETYDALITYLQNDVQAIRHLAAEQLVRFAPKGKAINYDAAAAPEQRAQAQTAWRKLLLEKVNP